MIVREHASAGDKGIDTFEMSAVMLMSCFTRPKKPNPTCLPGLPKGTQPNLL